VKDHRKPQKNLKVDKYIAKLVHRKQFTAKTNEIAEIFQFCGELFT
jgi:hypothetical protein